jgi:F-type H+-transporting ATPase subunit delta
MSGGSHHSEFLAPARRYAEALFALAREKGQIAEAGADLVALRALIEGDTAISKGLSDTRTNREKRRNLIETKLAPGRHPLVAGLLHVLLARRREELLLAFFVAYSEVMEREEKLLSVVVQTATPLADDVRADLSQRIGKATGRPLRLTAEVRPELLGGMRFLIDSTLIDASVRTRLEKLQKNMLAARV